MSTLSKLFVVMILVLALVLLGVNATLFAMRADFKHKFVTEASHHYATTVVKSAELADAANRIDALTKSYDALKATNATLDTEITNLKGQIDGLTKESQVKQTALDKQTAALETIGRALDTQLQQINDAMAKFRAVENRTAVVRATNSGISAVLDSGGRAIRTVEGPGGARKSVEGPLAAAGPAGRGGSVYGRIGDAVAWMAAGAALAGLAAGAFFAKR